MPVIVAGCLKTLQYTIYLFLFVIYSFFFPKESIDVFSSLEIKVRRKRTINHQEEWVRIHKDKDTEKPRTQMVISPRILMKKDNASADASGWWDDERQAPEWREDGRHRNQIQFPYKAKQQGN